MTLGKKEEVLEYVLSKAHAVFLRYGYRKTTMGDLAKAAEVSRPALYLLYSNKEVLFRAVISRYFKRIQQLSEKRVGGGKTLSEKLESAMLTWVEDPYVELAKSPEENEIYESGYVLASDLRQEFSQLYISQLHSIFEGLSDDQESKLSQNGMKIQDVAELMARASIGLKREAQDVAALRQMLSDLRSIYLLALGE